MKFIKKYSILVISLLVIYGLFILGSVSGMIGITGNAIDLMKNKVSFIYAGAGIWALIMLTIFIWAVLFRKAKGEALIKKDRKLIEKDKKELNNKKRVRELREQVREAERKLKRKELLKQKQKAKEEKKPKKSEKIYIYTGEKKDKKISNKDNIVVNDLLSKGGKYLMEKDFENARKIYRKIKERYDPGGDEDKKLYDRIMNYYNILEKKR